MTYYFGAENPKHSPDYVFSANENGDVIITSSKTGFTREVKLEEFADKQYNCFEALISAILNPYPADASVYITNAGGDAINNQVFKNQRYNKLVA